MLGFFRSLSQRTNAVVLWLFFISLKTIIEN